MRDRRLTVVVCLVVLAALSVAMGCRNYFTEERNRYRIQSVQEDRTRMSDDWDWFWGLDEPNAAYELTFPPYKY
ncbi:MAG: hypothetical protein R6X33_19170 [Candidatus Brocadiia bacterium]|jgi:hypothetical protein